MKSWPASGMSLIHLVVVRGPLEWFHRIVCIANLKSEERRVLDRGQVRVKVSECTQARWCCLRVMHAYCKLASRGSMAAQLTTPGCQR